MKRPTRLNRDFRPFLNRVLLLSCILLCLTILKERMITPAPYLVGDCFTFGSVYITVIGEDGDHYLLKLEGVHKPVVATKELVNGSNTNQVICKEEELQDERADIKVIIP